MKKVYSLIYQTFSKMARQHFIFTKRVDVIMAAINIEQLGLWV